MADPLRNACVTAVREELGRYGLRSEALIVNNGHVEVSWNWQGQRRFSRMSATPSDNFAHLKALADVRRILRRDGAQIPTPSPKSLTYALSVPKPIVPQADRLSRLEADFSALLDLLGESTEELNSLREAVAISTAESQELKAKLAGLRVTVSFGEQSVAAPVVTASNKARSYTLNEEGPSARILAFMPPGKWVAKVDIRKALKLDDKILGSMLQYLKAKKGSVENGQRGMWRKKASGLALVENG